VQWRDDDEFLTPISADNGAAGRRHASEKVSYSCKTPVTANGGAMGSTVDVAVWFGTNRNIVYSTIRKLL
jgi:hypothetical protein